MSVGDVTRARDLGRSRADADVVVPFRGADQQRGRAPTNPDADFHAERRADAAPARRLPAARPASDGAVRGHRYRRPGVPTRLPVDEDATDNPITVYDRHKLMAGE